VNIQEFLKQALAGEVTPAPVFLFYPFKLPRARENSFEELLVNRAVKALVDHWVDPSLRDLCLNTYQGDEGNLREAVAVANTLPFLAERRVIILQRADDCFDSEKAAGPLLDYLESPCESTVLLIVAARADRRTKLFKACEKNGVLVECPSLLREEALLWARAEFEARDKQVEAAALRELLDRTGLSLSEVNNAIQIVCNFAGTEAKVTLAHVREACTSAEEENVWQLTDAISASDTTKALKVLHEMLLANNSEFMILGMINWLMRTAYAAAAGGEALAKLASFQATKVRPLAQKIGLEKFPDAFALCTKTDLLMRSTGVDRSLALELLVIKLAAPRRRS
jgi:DNA polymerase III subunit delta